MSGIYLWGGLIQNIFIFLLRSWVIFQLWSRIQNSFLYGMDQVSGPGFCDCKAPWCPKYLATERSTMAREKAL